jgi:sterol desaturase/sphingolipid hydroxylase (fatty acid hydroxylase superfamily)
MQKDQPQMIDPEADRWNYYPKTPVPLNPLFEWPPRPMRVLAWYRGAWLQLTSLGICLAIAVLSYVLLYPSVEAAKTFAPMWMFQIWLANMIPQIVVAGTLHWWLYRRKAQGNHMKFDKRPLAENNGIFTFNNQVYDNVFWTLASAMTVATVYQWGIWWAAANEWVPVLRWADHKIWIIAVMFFIPMWSGLHFYWVHRLEHQPFLYRRVHALHHRNVNTGPWSGISNHWYENILYFTTYFIHLVVPFHPLNFLFHIYFQQVSPVLSHSGFERVSIGDTDALKSGDFFHQLHHKYFECNYGTSEIPFDRWFGTFHDGTDAATKRTRAFKKQMYTK